MKLMTASNGDPSREKLSLRMIAERRERRPVRSSLLLSPAAEDGRVICCPRADRSVVDPRGVLIGDSDERCPNDKSLRFVVGGVTDGAPLKERSELADPLRERVAEGGRCRLGAASTGRRLACARAAPCCRIAACGVVVARRAGGTTNVWIVG